MGITNRTLFQPVYEPNYHYLNYYKKEELMDLARENFNIYQRLNAKNSSYNLVGHLRDYEKAQYYKKNYCKYPSIDFYRTRKSSSSFCSIFNYCTFNNYNNINNEFSNEYNKKKFSKTVLKNKSYTELNRTNKERQKKLNDIVKNHYELKYYYEDKNQNKYENIDKQENLNEEKIEQEKIKQDKKEEQNNQYNDFNYEDEKINEKFEKSENNDKDILNKNKDDNENSNKEEKEKEKSENGEEKELLLLKAILQYGKNEDKNEKKYTNKPLDENNEKKSLEKDENKEKEVYPIKQNKEDEIIQSKIKHSNKEDEIASDIIEDLDI